MEIDRKQLYLPWADDALIPGESAYALLNKLAWFSNRGPLQLVHDLKGTEDRPSPTTPKSLDYYPTGEHWKSIASLPHMPRFHGLQLDDYVKKFVFEPVRRYLRFRSSSTLRFCPDCISLGMHFEVLQLRFIDTCPQHKKKIVSCCKTCGSKIFLTCNSKQAPFSCDSCNASLLYDGLESLREYYGARHQIGRAYTGVVKKLSFAPNIYLHSYSKYERDLQSEVAHKQVMARELNSRPSGSSQPMTLASPYSVVKVERGESGRPRLTQLSNALLSSPKDRLSEVNESSERRLAQLRVGAWAMRNFHDHLACICAGRELMKDGCSCSSEFVDEIESHACSIGRGFAAWEAGQELRRRELLKESLWKAWGLKERFIRLFALYVLEKACLGSAIMRFIDRNEFDRRAWQRHGFSLQLAEPNIFSGLEVERAIIWLDFNQIDLDEGCHICDRKSNVQLQWLGGVIQNVPPYQLIQSLLQEYGTQARLAESGKWMHEEINRRVKLILKSGAWE